jgi:hypothetical protein
MVCVMESTAEDGWLRLRLQIMHFSLRRQRGCIGEKARTWG